MNTLLKSTAGRVVGKAYLSADHISDATGLDPAITISKNGGAFANPNAGASVMTEIGSGWYYFALAAEDTDTLGPLIIRSTHDTMDPMEVQFQVVETVVAANITQILGTALTETSGLIAAAFKKFFNVSDPVLTCQSVNQAQDNATTAEIKTAIEAAGSHLALIKEKTDQLTFTEANKVDATASAALSDEDKESIATEVVAGVVAATEISRLAEGVGAKTHVYTVLDGNANAIPDVRVFVYSNAGLTTLVARGTTNNYGQITFYLDAGTYYFVCEKAGYTFSNPDVEAVS